MRSWLRVFRHPLRQAPLRHVRPLIGLVCFVAGVLVLLSAAPAWLWLSLLGSTAAWWGWRLFTER